MLKQGLVQVYTGKSNQMNLSHIGLSLRATGQKLRVFLMGFLSHPFIKTENKALSFLYPNMEVARLCVKISYPDQKVDSRDREIVKNSINHIHKAMLGNNFDIIILEGINELVEMGIIASNDILNLIKEKPTNIELIFTGRNARDEIIEKADLVTEMVEHKGAETPWAIDGRDNHGCVEIVTGNGKGKTTHCLGRAMFFAASGIRSHILQFIKSPQAYGEVIAIKKFPDLHIKTMGRGFIFNTSKESKKHMEVAKNAWEASNSEIFSLKYRLIVLDEINITTDLGLLRPDVIKETISSRPENMHLILSGRNAHPEIREIASNVLEMKEIKHPFNNGVKARKGIEY